MEEAKRKRAANNPDSRYRFFPTKEEWTWAKRDIFSDEEAQGVERNWKGGAGHVFEDRRTDRGWKGMREDRTREQASGGQEEWTTVGPRGNRGRIGSQREGHAVQDKGNKAPTQRSGFAGSQRGVSRPNGAASGRQPTLGDYWYGKGRTEGGEDVDEGAEEHREDVPFGAEPWY